jgi:hypothetical protein
MRGALKISPPVFSKVMFQDGCHTSTSLLRELHVEDVGLCTKEVKFIEYTDHARQHR